MWTVRQQVESFHLEFLRGLVRCMPTQQFVVKGGCNLRFFLGSPRYSEDIDLDVTNVASHTLRNNVMRVLTGKAISITLRRFGIVEIATRSHKQTNTVQRFKVLLSTEAGVSLHTKIEFSRRGIVFEYQGAEILPAITSAYQVVPFVAPHYIPTAAAIQKILALAHRKEPQSRDVFDLYMLGAKEGVADLVPREHLQPDERIAAERSVDELEYRFFCDQVVEYLEPEDQNLYRSEQNWEAMRVFVLEMLYRDSA